MPTENKKGFPMTGIYCLSCAGNGKHEENCKMIGIIICESCGKPIAKDSPRFTIHRKGYAHRTCIR